MYILLNSPMDQLSTTAPILFDSLALVVNDSQGAAFAAPLTSKAGFAMNVKVQEYHAWQEVEVCADYQLIGSGAMMPGDWHMGTVVAQSNEAPWGHLPEYVVKVHSGGWVGIFDTDHIRPLTSDKPPS